MSSTDPRRAYRALRSIQTVASIDVPKASRYLMARNPPRDLKVLCEAVRLGMGLR